MKKLSNTVYVTTEGASLRKDGENLVVELDGIEKGRVPLHMLASAVVFGPILVTPALIGICAERGIAMVLLDRNGRFQARIEGPVAGNVLLRRAQYRAADEATDIVRGIVMGKIANQRAVVRRGLRDYGDEMPGASRAALETATDRMARILRRVQLSDSSVDLLRGSEGEAATLYFGILDHLIRSPDPELRWTGRSRRPPLDAMNALLSFFYTRCSRMTAARPVRRWGWTLPWASCTVIGRDVPASRWT